MDRQCVDKTAYIHQLVDEVERRLSVHGPCRAVCAGGEEGIRRRRSLLGNDAFVVMFAAPCPLVRQSPGRRTPHPPRAACDTRFMRFFNTAGPVVPELHEPRTPE